METTIFNPGEKILLERDYDMKKWSIASDDFDSMNPDHFSNGTTDRTYHELTKSEADRLNNLIDGDGSVSHVAVIVTRLGLKFTSWY